MTLAPPGSGTPRGPYAPSRERARFSSEFISALLRDFRHGGPAAIAKVRKYQPAAYMKICALLVPREMKVEHSGGVKSMSDEQLEQGIEAIQRMLEARAPGDQANVIDGTAETVALPAPDVIADDKLSDRPKSWMRRTQRSGRRSATRGSAREGENE